MKKEKSSLLAPLSAIACSRDWARVALLVEKCASASSFLSHPHASLLPRPLRPFNGALRFKDRPGTSGRPRPVHNNECLRVAAVRVA